MAVMSRATTTIKNAISAGAVSTTIVIANTNTNITNKSSNGDNRPNSEIGSSTHITRVANTTTKANPYTNDVADHKAKYMPQSSNTTSTSDNTKHTAKPITNKYCQS